MLDEVDVYRYFGGSRKFLEGVVGFEFVFLLLVYDVFVGGERGERGVFRRVSK